MYRPLVPCPSCMRHVLSSEPRCPFCASALPADLEARIVPSAPRRLSRAAAFVFGASMAVAGCADDGGGVVALYGTPPSDAGPDDDGGVMAKYGGPPLMDAGPDSPDDDGGVMAEYGAPAPEDAG